MIRSPISRFSRRDVLLILVGATAMYVLSTFFAPFSQGYTDNIVINAHLHNPLAEVNTDPLPPPPELKKPKPPKTVTTTSVETTTVVQTTTQVGPAARPTYHGLNPEQKVLHEAHSAPISLPLTSILHHAPGWTLFENIYMSNGTLFVVTETGDSKEFPDKLNMISTGLKAENTPENIAARIPTEQEMNFLTAKEATRRWAMSSKSEDLEGHEWRIRTVEGNTILFNDPRQFLRHYYHFVAELWFGVQAFWDGAFSPKSTVEVKYQYPFLSSFNSPFDKNQPPPKLSKTDKNQKNPNSLLTIQSLSSDYVYHAEHKIPPIDRAIFIHSNADGWRDGPGFNQYFLRAAYPSLTVEYEEDWQDRVESTIPHDDGTGRAFHFPLALVVDRSAAHKGDICGSQTQRTASEAWEYMFKKGQLRGWRVGGWWADVRESILRWAGVNPEYLIHPESHVETGDRAHEHVADKDVANTATTLDLHLPLPHDNKIVITYISRQSAGHRKLLPESHKGLVDALESLVKSRTKEGASWEFIPVEAEKLSKDEQMAIIAKTTILLGVHGNGLSHLVFMPPTRYSTVIEIFFPGGTANDYLWTSRALGMRHWAVWNDKYYTFPNRPPVNYPQGFQENEIPVDGQAVAQLIANRVDGLI